MVLILFVPSGSYPVRSCWFLSQSFLLAPSGSYRGRSYWFPSVPFRSHTFLSVPFRSHPLPSVPIGSHPFPPVFIRSHLCPSVGEHPAYSMATKHHLEHIWLRSFTLFPISPKITTSFADVRAEAYSFRQFEFAMQGVHTPGETAANTSMLIFLW